MNEQRSLIREILLNEFQPGHNTATEETKIIVVLKGRVQLITIQKPNGS